MDRNSFDWKGGVVEHWGLDGVDERAPMVAQASALKEDLAQVKFPSELHLDVGWYPEFSSNGRFSVVLVRGGDWDAPLFRETAASGGELRSAIERCLDALLQE